MKIAEKARELMGKIAGSRKAMSAAAALGILGMLMILFSGGKENEHKTEAPVPESGSAWTDYCADTERRLEGILSSIDGVGRVKVMITIGSTEEYIYAREEKEYATVRTDKGEEALVRRINTPVITGVAAVCEGAGSDRVREEVYLTVTSVLGISPRKVYVTKME